MKTFTTALYRAHKWAVGKKKMYRILLHNVHFSTKGQTKRYYSGQNAIVLY